MAEEKREYKTVVVVLCRPDLSDRPDSQALERERWRDAMACIHTLVGNCGSIEQPLPGVLQIDLTTMPEDRLSHLFSGLSELAYVRRVYWCNHWDEDRKPKLILKTT
jgi:hypothetical protein